MKLKVPNTQMYLAFFYFQDDRKIFFFKSVIFLLFTCYIYKEFVKLEKV